MPVFDDSIVGMQAVENTGTQLIAITQNARYKKVVARLVDRSINNYSELSDRFFANVCKLQ